MKTGEERRTLTRKRLLKRAGVGAAAAWAVPSFLTTGSALAASGSVKCVTIGQNTQSEACSACPENRDCGKDGNGTCGCFVDVKGCCFCGQCGPCDHLASHGCHKNSDCPPGWACGYSCCSSSFAHCIPPCGHAPDGLHHTHGAGTTCSHGAPV